MYMVLQYDINVLLSGRVDSDVTDVHSCSMCLLVIVICNSGSVVIRQTCAISAGTTILVRAICASIAIFVRAIRYRCGRHFCRAVCCRRNLATARAQSATSGGL